MPTKSINAVLHEQTGRLMKLPGVVGTAQGDCAGEPCILVLVAHRTSALLRQLPSSLDGYRVAVRETGVLRVLDDAP